MEILADKLVEHYSNKTISGFVTYYEKGNVALVSLRYFDDEFSEEEEIKHIYQQVEESLSKMEVFDILHSGYL